MPYVYFLGKHSQFEENQAYIVVHNLFIEHSIYLACLASMEYEDWVELNADGTISTFTSRCIFYNLMERSLIDFDKIARVSYIDEVIFTANKLHGNITGLPFTDLTTFKIIK